MQGSALDWFVTGFILSVQRCVEGLSRRAWDIIAFAESTAFAGNLSQIRGKIIGVDFACEPLDCE